MVSYAASAAGGTNERTHKSAGGCLRFTSLCTVSGGCVHVYSLVTALGPVCVTVRTACMLVSACIYGMCVGRSLSLHTMSKPGI